MCRLHRFPKLPRRAACFFAIVSRRGISLAGLADNPLAVIRLIFDTTEQLLPEDRSRFSRLKDDAIMDQIEIWTRN